MKRFFFHYNKVKSQQVGRVQISIHHDKKCIIVDNIQCYVPTQGKINKRQPYFVMQGFCDQLLVHDSDTGIQAKVY